MAHSQASTSPAVPGLRRELGRWDLTAIGVNQVLGAAVFAQPSLYAASVGALSWVMVAAVGLASLLIALSFAEVGSRFEGTGGPYLYTRAAFGRFSAFEVGWMMWFTRVASWAAVINVLATALGFYLPTLTAGWSRAALITVLIAVITAINIRGIRLSSVVVNSLTIGKLLPLVVFILVGLFFIDPSRLVPDHIPPLSELSATGLLLIFAFGGYEVVPVPAGEAHDPRRAVPFALVMTIIIVTIVMTLCQIVALGTLPGLAASKTPLADAALLFMGGAGALLLTVGAVFSTTGNNMGQALSGPRNLFALAEQGDLPRFFGWIHPRFRTPYTAILVTSGVALVLALSGRYGPLALVSALSRLLVYVATCAAALRLRTSRFTGRVNPPTFVVPFGPVIPAAAIAIALAMIAGARREQLIAGLIALAVGAVLYLIAVRTAPGREPERVPTQTR
jgi:basic amino acid/polyamine antiporter, APA family